MSQAFARLLEKARAKHGKTHPADAIFILCDTPEDVPRRVDVLIAAMTHEQIVDLLETNETAEDRRRFADEATARSRAELAACIAAAEKAKSDSADRL
jgi:hypothetical protein